MISKRLPGEIGTVEVLDLLQANNKQFQIDPKHYPEGFFEEIHDGALEWRNLQRRRWLNGEILEEDFWIIKRMEEMFPYDNSY